MKDIELPDTKALLEKSFQILLERNSGEGPNI